MKNNQTKRVLNISLSLFALLAMTAFLFAQIAQFEAYAIDGEDEVIAVEEVQAEETIKPTMPLDEPEILLEKYIEEAATTFIEEASMGSAQASDLPKTTARYWKLGAAEKKAYLKIKELLKSIAAGEENITEIEITYEDVFSDDILNAKYTADDLGIDTIAVNTGGNNWALTSEAVSKVKTKYPQLNERAIMNALTRDCPELLYWFDKTVGMSTGISYAYNAGIVNGEWNVWCTEKSCFYFAFWVSEEYFGGYVTDEEGNKYNYVVDNSLTTTVNTALSNATLIVRNVASQTDYEKLEHYSKTICDKVIYDDAAADEASNTPYGNPWQMIYVFDDNPNTNVVCEGYSKAFKFLCDLTTFNNNTIAAHIVSGEMGGGTGAGRHMWNLVSINGSNYLVDVTNCDAGTIGAPGLLFMVGTNETSQGSGEYNFLISGSRITFSYDSETKDIFTRNELLLATSNYIPCEHQWGELEIKEAKCEEAGSKKKTCSNCKETVTESIPATGHSYGKWTKVDDIQHQRVCAHDKSHVEKTNHTWDGGTVTKDAPAFKTFTCTACKATKTEKLNVVTKPTGTVTILNTIANSAKKTNDVIWDKSKVKNATNYEINWRPRGASKWVGLTVGNTVRGTTKGLNIKGLYEIRVRPKNSAGAGVWSKSVYRYFHTTEKIRLSSKSKGTFTMSWNRNRDATGYQVLYTTRKDGTGAAQNIKTVGASATSITVKDIKVNGKTQKLKSGTTYYVQVREIRRVGKITYIGNISVPVPVRVK